MEMRSNTELWEAQAASPPPDGPAAASLQCSAACRAHLLSSRATVEGFRNEIFKVRQRDPSIVARDDDAFKTK